MCLIMSTDSDRYSGIWNNLNNRTLIVKDNYHKTTTASYNVLCRYNKLAPPRQVDAPPAAVTFIQIGKPENNWRSFPEVTCYRFQDT